MTLSYTPWSLRQQRSQSLVFSEADLHQAITKCLASGAWCSVVVACAFTLTTTLTVPAGLAGFSLRTAVGVSLQSAVAGGPAIDVQGFPAEFDGLSLTRVSGSVLAISCAPALTKFSSAQVLMLRDVVLTGYQSPFTIAPTGSGVLRIIIENVMIAPAGASSGVFIGGRNACVSGLYPSDPTTKSIDITVTSNWSVFESLDLGAGGGLTISGSDNAFIGVTNTGGMSSTGARNRYVRVKDTAGKSATDLDLDAATQGTGVANQVTAWTGTSTLGGITAVNTAVLTTNGSGVPNWTTQAALLTGRLIRKPQVLTSGTSYSKPAGCNSILVELVGGGGGGGGASTAAASAAVGGGGAAGAYAKKFYDVSVLAGPFTYAIGGAGSAGANTGAAGGAGGDTTFTDGTTLVTAKGGGGGGGQVAGTTVGHPGGGSGVIATNGDVNGAGAPGGFGIRESGTDAVSGNGGSSSYGSGGAGHASAGVGTDAVGFGSGGGGATVSNGTAAVAGGAGTAGVIVITEWT